MRTLGITIVDDRNLYISSQEDALLMIQAVEAFFKNGYKTAAFHADLFYSHTRALLDELNVRLAGHGEQKFATVALLLETRTQLTEIILHLITSTFVNFIGLFDYDKSYNLM